MNRVASQSASAVKGSYQIKYVIIKSDLNAGLLIYTEDLCVETHNRKQMKAGGVASQMQINLVIVTKTNILFLKKDII